MRLHRLSETRFVNLNAVTDVERYVHHHRGPDAPPAEARVRVTVAAPAYDSAGSADWVTTAREIVLTGDDADRFWAFCASEADDRRPHDVGGYDS